MKLRAPRRFATAVTRIKNAIGEEAAAAAVDRSVSLIRKWADPDHNSRPNLPQALALDVAFVEGGHGEPPVLAMYQARLARAVATQAPSKSIDVVLSALAVQAAVGELSQSLIGLRTSGGGTPAQFTANERNQVLSLLERLQQQVADIEEALAQTEDDGIL